MDLGLAGRVALVMGASSGIGRGIALALAREGVRVAVASRSLEALEEVAAEARRAAAAAAADASPAAEEGTAGLAAAFAADTADLEGLARLPDQVRERLGGSVEILVTNTGGPPPGGALDADLEAWRAAHTNLVLAPRVLIEATLPAMRERGWGRIVNVGSSATVEPIPNLTLSNAHRLAAVGFFKTLAREVAADGVTVNTVATGKIDTERLASLAGSREAAVAAAREQVPAGRLGSPQEYGELVAFLCSERAAYLTGTVIPLDGGLLRSI